jgi:cobalamin biosynthesis Mg chelatase CobN
MGKKSPERRTGTSMKMSIGWWERQIACGLAALLLVPAGLAATNDLPQAPQPQGTAATAQQQNPGNNPAAGQNGQDQNQNPGQNQNQQPGQTSNQNSGQNQPAQGSSSSQENAPRQPMGTAVAPYVRPEGISASRPAGAAIAPAKQRRVRIYAIRIALLVGAAVAIGTVVAASEGSPNRP